MGPKIEFHRKLQSTLMSKLTGTHSETSEIDFTTLTTVPGTVKVHGAPIQILDLRASLASDLAVIAYTTILAGIIEGAADGKGRGRQGALPISTNTCACTNS